MNYSWYILLVLTASKHFISDRQIYLPFVNPRCKNNSIVWKQVVG